MCLLSSDQGVQDDPILHYSSYLKYCDINNLYRLAKSQKLPINGFRWVKNRSQFNEDFIKSYNEDGDEGYFLETDVQCPEEFDKLHNDSPFLPDRIKIGKVEKLVANFHE